MLFQGHCDDSGSGSHWLEVPREAVSQVATAGPSVTTTSMCVHLQVDDLTLRITSKLPAFPFSLAYAWRETPVKRFPHHHSWMTPVRPGTWACLCTATPLTSACPRRHGRRRAAAPLVSSGEGNKYVPPPLSSSDSWP